MTSLQKQALMNTYHSKLRPGDDDVPRPLSSPGVIRRGSETGLVRSSSLRQRSPRSEGRVRQRPPRLGAVGRTRSNSVPEEVTDLREAEARDPGEEVEVMRQFVASNKKIINRGDSIRSVGFRDKPIKNKLNYEGEKRGQETKKLVDLTKVDLKTQCRKKGQKTMRTRMG